MRARQLWRIVFIPPNLGLSRHATHVPQSPRRHATHVLHRPRRLTPAARAVSRSHPRGGAADLAALAALATLPLERGAPVRFGFALAPATAVVAAAAAVAAAAVVSGSDARLADAGAEAGLRAPPVLALKSGGLKLEGDDDNEDGGKLDLERNGADPVAGPSGCPLPGEDSGVFGRRAAVAVAVAEAAATLAVLIR